MKIQEENICQEVQEALKIVRPAWFKDEGLGLIRCKVNSPAGIRPKYCSHMSKRDSVSIM